MLDHLDCLGKRVSMVERVLMETRAFRVTGVRTVRGVRKVSKVLRAGLGTTCRHGKKVRAVRECDAVFRVQIHSILHRLATMQQPSATFANLHKI